MSGANATEPLLPDVGFRPSGRSPPLPRSNHHKHPPLHSERSERLVLVRDPPRERLGRARSLVEPEETLLARVEGKQDPYRHPTTTTTKPSTSAVPFPTPSVGSPTIEEEFYTDLYQYYYDVTTPNSSNETSSASSRRVKTKSNSTSSAKATSTSRPGKYTRERIEDIGTDDGSDTEIDERRHTSQLMAKKRGSLQAIFVPSFLHTSAPSDIAASPPASPTSTTASKVVQRLRALSSVSQTSTASASYHTTPIDVSPVDASETSIAVTENGTFPSPPHQRKRSTTFSIMTSLGSSSLTYVASSIPSPTTPTVSNPSTFLSMSRNSPPPAFLQDDDPFANLTSAPSELMAIRSIQSPILDASPTPLPPLLHPIPRSPLNESGSLMLPSVSSVLLGSSPLPSPTAIVPTSTSPMLPSPLSNNALPISKNVPIATNLSSSSSSSSTPQKIKPKSAPSSPPGSASASTSVFPHPLLQTHSHPYPQAPSSPRMVAARPQPRPAHQRPAFSSRPSLPSLNTLARMNVVLTKKVRKGRVGAGLPFEPWDLPSDDESLPIPPPPLSASASSSNSSRSISNHNSPVTTTNAEPNATSSTTLNVNANPNASNEATPHLSTPSSPIPSMMSTSSSVPSSPIPIPLSSPSATPSSFSSLVHPGLGSSYLHFDSDSSSSNSTTPTSSLISAKTYTRSRPPSPSPLTLHNTHVAPAVAVIKPQPLLPSQILALGSVAADVEMIVPVHGNGNGDTVIGNPRTSSLLYSRQQQQQQPQPWGETDGPSVLQSSSKKSLSLPLLPLVEDEGSALEEEGDVDGYFGEFLDRYQRPSRAGSEEGHGAEEEVEVKPEVDINSGEPTLPALRALATVGEEATEELDDEVDAAKTVPESALAITIPENPEPEENLSTSDHLSSYASGSGEVDVDVDGEASPGLTRSDSMFSSPPSSVSLSRSFSMTSVSSIGSGESGSGVEHAGRRPEGIWSYRRFADPSQSLSSLELDFDGDRGEEGHEGFFETGIDAPPVSRERGGTRSSSDDGDAMQLSTPGDNDLSFFPYSHAGTFARFYQSSYSTLFSPASTSKEGGPSFLADPGHHDPSSPSSSVDDLGGGEREAEMWERPFSEEEMDTTMSGGGFSAEMSGSRGYGFGFDKVLIAAEECQEDDVEKEKESLANTTSIAPVRATSTISRGEADQLSLPSSDHSQPTTSPLPSPSSPVDPEISPLDSKSVTQTVDSPGSLIDDEMITRARMGPSNYSQARPRTTTTMNSRTSSSAAEPIDSSGYQRRGSSNSQSYSGRSSHSHGQTTNYNTSGSTSISASSCIERRRNNDDDDEDEERRRRQALERMLRDNGAMEPRTSSSSSDEDNYGEPATNSRSMPWKRTMTTSRPPPGAHPFTDTSRSPSLKRMEFPASSNQSSRYVSEDESEEDDEEDDDDDDVPLAQRIPGALTAQKTIRRKFREEREQRKREKAERMQQNDADRRTRQETLRPAGAGIMMQDGVGMIPSSSSHEAAMLAASAMYGQARQRTLTLPGKSSNSPPSAFNPHDLARKLQNVQMAEVASPIYQQQYQYQQHQDMQKVLSPTHTRAKSLSRSSVEQSRSPSQTAPPPLPPLNPTRSRSIRDPSPTYQRPGTSPSSLPAVQGPPNGTLRPMRSFHRPSEHRSLGHDDPPPPLPTDQRLGRSSTSASRHPYHHRSPSQSRMSSDRPERMMEPVPPLPAPFKALQNNDDSKKLVKPNPGQEPRVPSSRISGEGDHPPRVGIAQQPMPGLNVNKVVVSQQRIFVGNLQQFHMVEIGPTTTAGDVISMMEAEGALNGWAGSGGWMVFEIAQDFGMERPVRGYELLADVQASWLKDKSVNFFVLRLTPLAIPLSRSAIPSSSPTHSGYIEWEAKRGKWSKRWLQLREHNLYLSKRDNGKDEVLICSLSNFDAYQITRNHRAPKPFAFAIKSTDNLSFFENTADYLHTFSCNEKDGKIWLEKILVARSYVLHQERQVLFKPTGSNVASAAVSRSGTKKYTPVRPNHQPLVALAPNGVFEPGSLLGKHL